MSILMLSGGGYRMQAIPSALQTRFEDHLRSKAIPESRLWAYRKWLRYYLDYCEKYRFSPRDRDSLPRFIGKLRDKKQTEEQQRQATEAIKLYYEVLGQERTPSRTPRPQPLHRQEGVPYKGDKPLAISESPVIRCAIIRTSITDRSLSHPAKTLIRRFRKKEMTPLSRFYSGVGGWSA
jgi:hypothetical protein